uniref:Fibroblast growth factor 9 n=1 Tax=Gouania willdenowi TaxID=441366 RepID=A0A8C5I367_GOUWI
MKLGEKRLGQHTVCDIRWKCLESLRGVGGGDKQLLLYCRVGIGFHLQILLNGSVGGVHQPNEYLTSIRRGVVGILGVKSGLYLCMNAEGQETFSDECLLRENLEENHYTTYSSLSHPGLYVALTRKGRLRNGRRAKPHQACSHFLPRRSHF